jgi:hypothetical protein
MPRYGQCLRKTSSGPVGWEEEVTWKTWWAEGEVGVTWQLVGHA